MLMGECAWDAPMGCAVQDLFIARRLRPVLCWICTETSVKYGLAARFFNPTLSPVRTSAELKVILLGACDSVTLDGVNGLHTYGQIARINQFAFSLRYRKPRLNHLRVSHKLQATNVFTLQLGSHKSAATTRYYTFLTRHLLRLNTQTQAALSSC